MRNSISIALGAMLLLSCAQAQTAEPDNPATTVSNEPSNPADSVVGSGTVTTREYVPMTASERARHYLKGAFGPSAFLRAAAAAGISQWTETPKEWGVGAAAYGDRIGNVFAKHVIREALEYGVSTALHEDNRYFRSEDTGFLKRSKHAFVSVFIARNEAGGEHFAYSRFAAVAGSSFISRAWQPHSENNPESAAMSFGLTMVSDIGWNFFKEFCPQSFGRLLRIR